MKKSNLTFVFCLTVFLLSAQDYLVTFSGIGESTIVSTVTVENMTQGKSLTLNGNDVLHLKSTVTAIYDIVNKQKEGIQFYPNPMKEFSVMEFVMPEEGAVKIELFDITGRKLTLTQSYLNQGRHCYRITGIGNGIYVLKVAASNYLFSGKLISNKKTSEMVYITYQNTNAFNNNPADTKSAKSEILMQYNTGDVLKFFATGGEHNSVKVDVISESKNINFSFYKCSDADKRNYTTVKIGKQIWMAENLAYLPAVSPSSAGSYTQPFYYVYKYEGNSIEAAKATSNYTMYGVLYNWPAAKAACPSGWHLPSNNDWDQLEKALGMTQAQIVYGWHGTDQGTQMKTTSGWYSNGNGTNTSGFSALPGDYRHYTGFSYIAGTTSHWWSSMENTASSRHLDYRYNHLAWSNDGKEYGFSVRCLCDDNTQSGLAGISTFSTYNISQTTATIGSYVTEDGGEAVTARGVCWSTNQNPTTANSKTINGTGTGSFTSNLTGLTAETHYYVRAYATNSQGTAYGTQKTFNTSGPTGTFTDLRDGRTYKTAIIHGKEWMAENLAYMPTVSPPSAGSYTQPYYYVYGYDGTSVAAAKNNTNFYTYGVLYNWPAAKAACPSGWHLPSDDEWKQLEKALGMTQAEADNEGYRGIDLGTQMKATSGWNNYCNESNSSGFSALPGGRCSGGDFYDIRYFGCWWSSTEISSGYPWYRVLNNCAGGVLRDVKPMNSGFSVRCVKD